MMRLVIMIVFSIVIGQTSFAENVLDMFSEGVFDIPWGSNIEVIENQFLVA